MSNRLFIPPRQGPTNLLVTPQGIIARKRPGESLGGAFTPVGNPQGAHLRWAGDGTSQERQSIISAWVNGVNAGTSEFIAGTQSTAIWYDGFSTTAGGNMVSASQSTQAAWAQNAPRPGPGNWAHCLWVFDGDKPPLERARFFYDGVESPRGGGFGTIQQTRTFSNSQRVFCIGNGAGPFICDGVAEFWIDYRYKYQEGDVNKFYSPSGPISLGADGSLPYGTQPPVYLGGDMTLADWNAADNRGYAPLTIHDGLFTEFEQ